LVFEKGADFFRRKLAKIAENCDRNIDPRSRVFFFLFEGLIVILDAHSDMLTPGSVDTDSEGLRAILNFTPGPQG
jgi:hypothetical protein